jgi:hypothetical protein
MSGQEAAEFPGKRVPGIGCQCCNGNVTVLPFFSCGWRYGRRPRTRRRSSSSAPCREVRLRRSKRALAPAAVDHDRGVPRMRQINSVSYQAFSLSSSFRRTVSESACASLRMMASAVLLKRESFDRIAVNTLSTEFVVRKHLQCTAGKSQKVKQRRASPVRRSTVLSVDSAECCCLSHRDRIKNCPRKDDWMPSAE